MCEVTGHLFTVSFFGLTLWVSTFAPFIDALEFLRTFVFNIVQVWLVVQQGIALSQKTWGFSRRFKSQRAWTARDTRKSTTLDQSHRAAVFTEDHLLRTNYIARFKLVGGIIIKSVLWGNLQIVCGIIALRGSLLVILVHAIKPTSKVSLKTIFRKKTVSSGYLEVIVSSNQKSRKGLSIPNLLASCSHSWGNKWRI